MPPHPTYAPYVRRSARKLSTKSINLTMRGGRRERIVDPDLAEVPGETPAHEPAITGRASALSGQSAAKVAIRFADGQPRGIVNH
jgi:hypothetical protein